MVLTAREQQLKDIDARYNARMARLQRLNEAENRAAASDAAFAAIERARLTREAAEREARITAFYERQAQRARVVAEQKASVDRLFALLAKGRQRRAAVNAEGGEAIRVSPSGDGRVERRCVAWYLPEARR